MVWVHCVTFTTRLNLTVAWFPPLQNGARRAPCHREDQMGPSVKNLHKGTWLVAGQLPTC